MKLIYAVKNFLRKEDGPTAVEYAIMLALIFGAIVAAVGSLGAETNNFFTEFNEEVESLK